MDDSALTHRGGVGDVCSGRDERRRPSSYGNQSPAAAPSLTFQNTHGRDDSS